MMDGMFTCFWRWSIKLKKGKLDKNGMTTILFSSNTAFIERLLTFHMLYFC